MWKDFKAFAFKGNILDMAIGVIIGGAFGKIVTSLVNDIIMPAFGAITSGMDFKALKWVISAADEATGKAEAAVLYGQFIQNIVDFLIIAISMFVVISIIGKFKKKEEPAPEEPKGPTQEELLTEIRDLLKENAELKAKKD